MELKARKSPKQIKDSNLIKLKSGGEIDRFFKRLESLPDAESITLAACSKNIKVRIRAQFIMRFYAGFNVILNSTSFLAKPAFSTYLTTCMSFAKSHNIRFEDLVPPYDDVFWERLFKEYCKMLASKFLIEAIKEESHLIKTEVKSQNKGRFPKYDVQNNYEIAKENLAISFRDMVADWNYDNTQNFVLKVLNEFRKIKSLGELNTLREYFPKHQKDWNFYDFNFSKTINPY